MAVEAAFHTDEQFKVVKAHDFKWKPIPKKMLAPLESVEAVDISYRDLSDAGTVAGVEQGWLVEWRVPEWFRKYANAPAYVVLSVSIDMQTAPDGRSDPQYRYDSKYPPEFEFDVGALLKQYVVSRGSIMTFMRGSTAFSRYDFMITGLAEWVSSQIPSYKVWVKFPLNYDYYKSYYVGVAGSESYVLDVHLTATSIGDALKITQGPSSRSVGCSSPRDDIWSLSSSEEEAEGKP